MRLGSLAGLLCAGCGSILAAQSTVELSRAVYVERIKPGTNAKVIEPATGFRRGDTVILMVNWQTDNAGKAFTVTSAVPRPLQYQRSSQNEQTVSVDGGKNWGAIGNLRLGSGSDRRRASAEDVTHLRWRISAKRASRGSGQVTYSAIVR